MYPVGLCVEVLPLASLLLPHLRADQELAAAALSVGGGAREVSQALQNTQALLSLLHAVSQGS